MPLKKVLHKIGDLKYCIDSRPTTVREVKRFLDFYHRHIKDMGFMNKPLDLELIFLWWVISFKKRWAYDEYVQNVEIACFAALLLQIFGRLPILCWLSIASTTANAFSGCYNAQPFLFIVVIRLKSSHCNPTLVQPTPRVTWSLVIATVQHFTYCWRAVHLYDSIEFMYLSIGAHIKETLKQFKLMHGYYIILWPCYFKAMQFIAAKIP